MSPMPLAGLCPGGGALGGRKSGVLQPGHVVRRRSGLLEQCHVSVHLQQLPPRLVAPGDVPTHYCYGQFILQCPCEKSCYISSVVYPLQKVPYRYWKC